jgi:hypothetical protein
MIASSPNEKYNVILSSQNCTSVTASNANNDKSYSVDWTALMPEGQYLMNFTYQGASNNIQAFNNIPTVWIDFGISQNNVCSQASSFAQRCINIGSLFPTLIDYNGHIQTLRADLNSNCSIYLQERPSIQELRVQILTPLKVAWVDDTPVTPVANNHYVLCLHFELLRRKNLK